MPEFAVPGDASIEAARAWFGKKDLFRPEGEEAVLNSAHDPNAEPLVVVMAAAWSAWCRAEGYTVRIVNESDASSVPRQVRRQTEATRALDDISSHLRADIDAESVAALRFCSSELTRNVLEHANSSEGAFIAFRRSPESVTLAVADCGQGIPAHIVRAHPDISDDLTALGMAMRPGVTGAQAGSYGTPDNAGAGLYITRAIAKATGGSFFLASARAAYSLQRAQAEDDMIELFADPFDDPRGVRWTPEFPWIGTVASVEIRTNTIAHYENLVEWVLKQVPRKPAGRRKIRFT